MSEINNNETFKKTLKGLECSKQRQLAVLFIENVLSLNKDERIPSVLAVASSEKPTPDGLEAAMKLAMAVILDNHCRCGADCNWEEQAGYFIGRAAAASVAQKDKCLSCGAAWQAAVSCRMARTCAAIESEDQGVTADESEQQFRILNEFLKNHP